MRICYGILYSLIVLFSCKSKPESIQGNNLQTNTESKQGKDSFIVLDSLVYPKDSAIKDEYEWIEKDNKLIFVNTDDTVSFPTYPKRNQDYMYEYGNDTIQQRLQIKRIDNWKIAFELYSKEKEKTATLVKDTAQLGDYFFLASESDEDEQGLSYLACEYRVQHQDCYISISLNDEDGSSARISAGNCPGENILESVALMKLQK